LKTWSIKVLDIYRNEVISEAKTDKVQAFKNFMKLTALLVLMNATADELKDFIRGRKTPLKDKLIDQLLTILGFSRYYIWQAEREGIGSALLDIVKPPTKLIDNLWKDGNGVYKSFKDYDKSVEINKFKTLRSIPLAGELYYWWFGKGVDYKDDRGEATFKPTTGDSVFKDAEEQLKRAFEEQSISGGREFEKAEEALKSAFK
jgi:hypothetical protein